MKIVHLNVCVGAVFVLICNGLVCVQTIVVVTSCVITVLQAVNFCKVITVTTDENPTGIVAFTGVCGLLAYPARGSPGSVTVYSIANMVGH